MKKGVIVSTVCLLLLLLATLSAFTQVKEAKRLEAVFGPRVGINWKVVDPGIYNEELQKIFPSDRNYFPIFTIFGLSLEQRIRLGQTQSHFAFQELLTLGGIDQGLLIPTLTVLIGFRSRMGLEFGLGPTVNLKISSEGVQASLTVVYAVGWTFSFQDVFVPVDLAVAPTPADKKPNIALLTGFNFKIR